MVTANAGGSNGYRNRLWKADLDLDDSRIGSGNAPFARQLHRDCR